MSDQHRTIPADLEMAIRVLRRTGAGFVIVGEQRVLAASADHGIHGLLEAAERLRLDGRSGGALADRVVGRAALLVAAWAEIRSIHGELASDAAVREAEHRGLVFSYRERVPMVLNRARDGCCPFEAATHDAGHPDEAVSRLRATLMTLAARRRA